MKILQDLIFLDSVIIVVPKWDSLIVLSNISNRFRYTGGVINGQTQRDVLIASITEDIRCGCHAETKTS